VQSVADFVGRQAELDRLARLLDSPRAEIAVLYGRRCVGKTVLLERALAGRPALFFEALEDRPKKEQIAHFLYELRLQTGSKAASEARPPDTWKEAFMQLFQAIEKNPMPVVLDEFQWLANYRYEIVSDLKYVWDRHFSKLRGQKLLLCGSVASFMIEKVLKSKALYGRIDVELQIEPFKLAETRQMLPGRGQDEILEAHMLTGGIPRYLRLLSEYPSIQLAMEELAFTRLGYFTKEYERIFVSHFGKHPNFEAIVRALSNHPMGLYREELAREAEIAAGGQLTTQLRDLKAAGFIGSAVPFNKDERTARAKYFLNDAYLRFYFAFVEPNLRAMAGGSQVSLFGEISRSGAYYAWIGRAFEYLCTQHADVIAQILGFSGIRFSVGPYFARAQAGEEGVQIDLLFDRPDRVLTVCELKYGEGPIGMEVIPEMKRKLRLLEPVAGRKTLQPVLIVRNRPSQALIDSRYFYRIIEARQMLMA
jgi:uncharacterized protein